MYVTKAFVAPQSGLKPRCPSASCPRPRGGICPCGGICPRGGSCLRGGLALAAAVAFAAEYALAAGRRISDTNMINSSGVPIWLRARSERYVPLVQIGADVH